MVLRELRCLAQERSHLRVADVPPALAFAAREKFGKFSAACGAAGLEVHSKRTWTREIAIRELRAVALRGPPSKASAGPALYHVCLQLFGSLSAAREAAGVGA
jgi:hypothetical protein